MLSRRKTLAGSWRDHPKAIWDADARGYTRASASWIFCLISKVRADVRRRLALDRANAAIGLVDFRATQLLLRQSWGIL